MGDVGLDPRTDSREPSHGSSVRAPRVLFVVLGLLLVATAVLGELLYGQWDSRGDVWQPTTLGWLILDGALALTLALTALSLSRRPRLTTAVGTLGMVVATALILLLSVGQVGLLGIVGVLAVLAVGAAATTAVCWPIPEDFKSPGGDSSPRRYTRILRILGTFATCLILVGIVLYLGYRTYEVPSASYGRSPDGRLALVSLESQGSVPAYVNLATVRSIAGVVRHYRVVAWLGDVPSSVRWVDNKTIEVDGVRVDIDASEPAVPSGP